MGVAYFADDDAGYQHWIGTHPTGWVLNTTRPPSASYLLLHHASCWTISGRPARGRSWTKDYVKVCSETRPECESWARSQTGGEPRACGHCSR